MKLLSNEANKIIYNLFKRQHPILAELIINWGKIVGIKFSSTSSPLKISSGTDKGKKFNILYISVENNSISLEMAYQQDLMLERIAIYLGYKGIHKIKLMVKS